MRMRVRGMIESAILLREVLRTVSAQQALELAQ